MFSTFFLYAFLLNGNDGQRACNWEVLCTARHIAQDSGCHALLDRQEGPPRCCGALSRKLMEIAEKAEKIWQINTKPQSQQAKVENN